ncbi:MAG TPA: hypothetical protein VG900_17505 [Hyphomicrobiaceae bacterium]|nr:hypothetical protein [Hyphomicrobiaceae bacterium]
MLGFLRFLAGVMLLVAVLAGVYDATRSMAADRYLATSCLDHWSHIAPDNLAKVRTLVRRNVAPAAWDAGIVKVLELPAWALFGGAGLLLGYAGRRRRRVNVFAN